MNGTHVLLTLGKELRETLRDRRTLMVMVLFPVVVYPMLSLVMTQVMTEREKTQEARPSQVAVMGAGPVVEEIRRRLSADSKTFVLVPVAVPADVETGHVDAIVDGPTADVPARLSVLYDASRDESRRAEQRLSKLLGEMLPEGCTPRFTVEGKDLASGAKLGGYVLSKALPALIILMVLLGAFYPAIDVTAGERERGTLETLLAAPVRRFDLLLGKVLAVTTLAVLTGLLNLLSMSITVLHALHLAAPEAVLPVPWTRVIATSLVVFPSGFLFAATFVAIGSMARGFKEAQNLLMPVYVLTLVPTLAAAVGDLDLRGMVALVPGMNVTLLAREIILGRATIGQVLAVLGSTLVIGAVAVGFATRFYQSEHFIEVRARPRRLLRGPSYRASDSPRTGAPTAGEAMALYGVGFALLYFAFIPLQKRDLVTGLMLSQWGGLLGLAVLFARVTRRRLADVFGLSWPTGGAVVGAVLVGLSGGIVLTVLTEWVMPPPRQAMEELRRALLPQDGSRTLAEAILAFAITPALCEEAFFRGPILRGLRGRLGATGAIVVTGALFGLFHIDVWRIVPTGLLGVLLSFLAWRTGSLVPAIIAHGVNNALVLVLTAKGADQSIEVMGRRPQAAVLAGGCAVLALGLLLITRGPRPQGEV